MFMTFAVWPRAVCYAGIVEQDERLITLMMRHIIEPITAGATPALSSETERGSSAIFSSAIPSSPRAAIAMCVVHSLQCIWMHAHDSSG